MGTIYSRARARFDLKNAWSKRNDQGNHECEVWTPGAEGSYQWETCTKNPGHKNFIPAENFSLKHLPQEYQDEDVCELIRLQSERTVRVKVRYTSPKRPDGYIFSNHRGKGIMHTGSGSLFSFTDVKHNTPCPCPECEVCPEPCMKWGRVWVGTAKHVVYDDQEAKKTKVDVSLNDGTGTKMMELYGYRVVSSDHTEDRCDLECVTHNMDLFEVLMNARNKIEDLWQKVHEKYEADERCPPLAVISSHPHGCTQHITVGVWKDRTVRRADDEDGIEETSYTYDTPTCKGSSGAPVFILGQGAGKVWAFRCGHHTHSSGRDGPGTFNQSGIYDEYPVLTALQPIEIQSK